MKKLLIGDSVGGNRAATVSSRARMIHAFISFELLEYLPLFGRFSSAPSDAYAGMRQMLQEGT